jgi:hypothetical protein
MQDAVLDRLLEVNPVVGTKPPRTVKPKHTTWTGAQLHAFLEGLDPRTGGRRCGSSPPRPGCAAAS